MKLLSWNVNGLRAVVRSEKLAECLKKTKPDILCLQETKISNAKFAKEEISFPGYEIMANGAKREGYSGTAIIIKSSLIKEMVSIKNGFGQKQFDDEGRIQILEFREIYLLNIYFPNSNPTLGRLKYKQQFNQAILRHIKVLEKKKPVIVTGDFNVAHQAIDLARPKENDGSAGYTEEERVDMDKFVEGGLVDSFRYKNGQKVKYSWWSFRMNARQRNVGWRIDYFLVGEKMKNKIAKADILTEIQGSDHCPVLLDVKI
jgi:exodeoxyribonuclease-3